MLRTCPRSQISNRVVVAEVVERYHRFQRWSNSIGDDSTHRSSGKHLLAGGKGTIRKIQSGSQLVSKALLHASRVQSPVSRAAGETFSNRMNDMPPLARFSEEAGISAVAQVHARCVISCRCSVFKASFDANTSRRSSMQISRRLSMQISRRLSVQIFRVVLRCKYPVPCFSI